MAKQPIDALADELQVSQVTGETPWVLDEASRLPVHAALDILCWVLEHRSRPCASRTMCNCGQPATLAIPEVVRADGTVLLFSPPLAVCGECAWRRELEGQTLFYADVQMLDSYRPADDAAPNVVVMIGGE